MSREVFEAFRAQVKAKMEMTPPDQPGQPRSRGHGDDAFRLALAGEKLLLPSAEAIELYTGIAREHDLRDAWLGLACAHHLRSEAAQAAEVIDRVLRRHAFVWDNVALIESIAEGVGAPGWCSLEGTGELNIRLMRPLSSRTRPVASMDQRALTLRARPSGLAFAARLPTGWQRCTRLTVQLDGVELLGSALEIDAIVRVEGFVDSTDGDLHGWAWCPNDPDRDPILTVGTADGKHRITVVADDRSVAIRHERLQAAPRGFRVPPDRLRHFEGPVHVQGAGGSLTGSPLDPTAERRSAETAARILAGLFPAPGPQ
jgi:hypothetical protein